MLTICTACGTQFRVNTAQLRAVHGLVRCSRCHSVFDAFETLREEFEPFAPVTTEKPTAETTPDAVVEHQELPEISTPPTAPEVDGDDTDIQLEQDKEVPVVDDLFATLWGEVPEPGMQPAVRKDADSDPEPTPGLIEDRIPKPATLLRDQALYKHVELPPRELPALKTGRRHFKISRWGVSASVMALLLAAQLVNAHRIMLSRAAVIGPPLSVIYSAFGHPLKPRLSPSTWRISDINVTSDPDTPGALSISGILANGASFAQPWPVLRIELTDRYGDPLQARDFTANVYLPASKAAVWLNPGLAARFRIDVVDPGPEAVGFRVQPCIELQGERTCANTAAAN